MPGSGQPLLWNENSPAETDIADAAPIRSLETSLRFGLAVEHNWPSSSGPNFGYHLLGSARAYYDTQSNVSSSGTDGRLQVTSDTSRLFHVGSAGTMFLGGQNSLSAGSSPVGGQRFYWAQEWDEVFITATPATITFQNSGFSGVPVVIISASTISAAVFPLPVITGRTATSFTIKAMDANLGGTSLSKFSLMYISIGTRTF